MKYYKSFLLIGLVFFLVTLTGCLQSEDKVMNEIEKRLKDEFLSDEKIEANFELKRLSVYKPDSLELQEEGINNFIFTDGSRPYVLFINEFEAPNSKWFYNRLKSENKNNKMFLRSFESDEEFVYLAVQEHEDKQYEVQIGIGGIKMSTLTNIKDLETVVSTMLDMIQSVEEK
ncbi:hypothetical protein ACLIA0_08770 [Bacillaceae bacterium W0354]